MLTAGESKNCPRTVGDAPVHCEDEGADAAWQRFEMVEEGADLIKRVLPVYVIVGLGFGDEKVCMRMNAPSDDVRSIATNERRNWITG